MTWQQIDHDEYIDGAFLAYVATLVNGKPSHDIHIIWLEDETYEVHPDCYQGWDFEDYTHWMPLPEPPKGGE